MPWSSWTTRSPTARSVNAVSGGAALVLRPPQRAAAGAEDLGLGEQDERPAPGSRSRPSTRRRRSRATRAPSSDARPRRLDARARAGSGAGARPGARRPATSRTRKPSARQRPISSVSWAKRPVKRGDLLRVEHVLGAAARPRRRRDELQLDALAGRRARSRERPAARAPPRSARRAARARRRSPAPPRAVVEQARGAGARRRRAPSGSTSSSSSASVERCERGIEEADRLDVVAEELEPRRARMAGREDVDDAAAHAPLPDLDDRLDPLVAGSARTPPAAARARGGRRRRCAACAPRTRRGAGSGVSSAAGVATTTSGSPAASRRAITARSASASRWWPPRQSRGSRSGNSSDGRAEELEVLRPAVGVGHARDHDEGGRGWAWSELGDDEGAGGAGEAGDAQTGVSLGEGFRQRFERLPLSQHRTEHFTVSRPLDRRAAGRAGERGMRWGSRRPRGTRPLLRGGWAPSGRPSPAAAHRERVDLRPPPVPPLSRARPAHSVRELMSRVDPKEAQGRDRWCSWLRSGR